MSDDRCPVCLQQPTDRRTINSAIPFREGIELENRSHSDSGYCIECSACGKFVVTHMDDVNLKSTRLRNWNPAHLSALVREQSIRPLPTFWLQYGSGPYGPFEWQDALAPIGVDELLARWPRTVPERIERTLCNLARRSPTAGYDVDVPPDDTAFAFAQTPDEAQYHINALVASGLLNGKFVFRSQPSNFSLTPKGWSRFEELTHGTSAPENPVFVAMWFGGTEEKSNMDEAYSQAIELAVTEAGYKVTRVDLVEHNDWIMDQVLGDIRLAPFVVADFTGNRGGVYLEAGFARGLGIPVIHTCREKDFKGAHFDIQQINTINWTTPEELRKKLYHRILGTIGQGPHPRPPEHTT